MREHAGLPRDTFDIRWVDTGLRAWASSPWGATVLPAPIASFTIGTTWVLNQEKFKSFALGVDVEALPTFLSDA